MTLGKTLVKFDLMRQYIIIFLLLTSSLLSAQDTLQLKLEAVGAVSLIDNALPHHLAFNRFGFLPTGENGGYTRLEIKKPFTIGKSWKLYTEFDGVANTEDIFIHEAYVNLKWKDFTLQVGKNEVNNPYFPDDLSTGHLFASRNARTIPKVTLGVLDYADVPWTKGYVQYRGAISQGILEKDRSVSEALYHEKYASIRTRKLPINIHFGFMHNALFGGEFNGERQSTNFLEVFLGRASSNSIVNGDNINAAGAHFGIFDYGVSLSSGDFDIDLYYHQPWADRTGLKDWSARNRDYMLGIHVKFKNQKWISEILYENLNTTHQSGEGLPDPFVNGVGYTFDQLRVLDYDQFVLDEFGITANNLSFDEFIEIIRQQTNENLDYGGRDNYYNNRGYPSGNTYQGFVIGNSLFLTANRLFELNGVQTFESELIVNNRIQAQHIGIKGNLVPWDIDYKFLVTFTHNLGTYTGFYGSFINNWERSPNYFFRQGVNAQYLYFELRKEMKQQPLTLTGSVGFDQRGFGNFFGMLAGVEYRLK